MRFAAVVKPDVVGWARREREVLASIPRMGRLMPVLNSDRTREALCGTSKDGQSRHIVRIVSIIRWGRKTRTRTRTTLKRARLSKHGNIVAPTAGTYIQGLAVVELRASGGRRAEGTKEMGCSERRWLIRESERLWS